MLTADDFKGIPAFANLRAEDYAWLAVHAEERLVEQGEQIILEGAPADILIIILEGETVFTSNGGARVYTARHGDITGMLPASRMTHWPGSSHAVAPSRIALVHKADFPAMLRAIPDMEGILIGVMSDRIRETTLHDQQREKLMSLGTMAAGLAHELNNPASAARRAAEHLSATLHAFNHQSAAMLKDSMFIDPPAEGFAFQELVDQMQLEQADLDPMRQSELEDELAAWLETMQVSDAWGAASTLVSGGFTRDWLEEYVQRLVPEHRANSLMWLAKDVEMRLLCRDLLQSTARMADLVTAMKSYSYLDQSPEKGEVCVHTGIEQTLIILRHKFKKRGLTVDRQYGDIPKAWGIGGELNQVWTNLLDNAIDVAPEGSAIRVRTKPDRDCVIVEIEDEGPGIPETVQNRIYVPFFTTKPVGSGTGLGLDIVHRIVVRRHGGYINFETRPGRTCFIVRLPVHAHVATCVPKEKAAAAR